MHFLVILLKGSQGKHIEQLEEHLYTEEEPRETHTQLEALNMLKKGWQDQDNQLTEKLDVNKGKSKIGRDNNKIKYYRDKHSN